MTTAGDLRSDPWRRAVEAVPRELFIPSFFRDIETSEGTMWAPVSPDLTGTRERLELVYQNETWVTQLDHKVWPNDTDVPIRGIPTSSSTLPGLVVRMLEELQVEDGQSVLEIGTGTGYSAALLSERLGSALLTSVEVDAEVARGAREGLSHAGYKPNLIRADGLAGHPAGALYDRVIATCSVRYIPPAWIEQTRPGGLILTTMLGWLGASSGLVRLVVTGNGTAEGIFLPGTDSFMSARPHEAPELPQDAWDRIDTQPSTDRPATVGPEILDPWEGWTSMFIAQLAAPAARHEVFSIDDPDTLHLLDAARDSYATVRGARPGGAASVAYGGPVDVWAEIESAISAWRQAEQPALDQFRITVTPKVETVYYDDPRGPLSWSLPIHPIR
ncbi:MAG TPA: ATP-grasp peptide maturase system methyltransferase [Kribbella sp.]